MAFGLGWMPQVLLDAGLKVSETPGWRERGRAEMGKVQGVLCHHTGVAAVGNMPSLRALINGRVDLVGPLCNLGLGRDGTYYVVAAGRANHAGPGSWKSQRTGVTVAAGNSCFIGIEAENTGRPDDPWPEVQMDAYARGVAALLRHIEAGIDMCVGHKEWAPARKVDPWFDMAVFRNRVGKYLDGATPPPPIAASTTDGRPTLRRGNGNPAAVPFIEEMQQKLGVHADGEFGPKTEAALRQWQRAHGLVPDGICGPKSWALLAGAPLPTAPAPVAGGHRLNARGRDLIQSFESCGTDIGGGRYEAYPDPGSKTGRPWTIGWGSTGPDIVKETVWTRQQCDLRFEQDMRRYVADVQRAIENAPTTANQFDALVSFHYNTGAIARATLTKCHVRGDKEAAALEFRKWIRNDGVVMKGLVRRRAAEEQLYRQPDG